MSVATPNMDQMVARLTQLSPQMLQQYAAQHQNDTMALLAAKAASDAQKKIMSAGKPQQMGIPPKVNEQVVESIAQPQAPQAMPQDQGLPEDSGIAQLPAPNMQGMAGGGIVAFSTGGINDVGQYLRSTDGGRTWSIDAPDVVRNPTKPYYSEVANPAAVLKGKTFGSRDEAASAYRAALTSGTPEVSSVRAIDMGMAAPAAAVNTPALDAPASNAAPAPDSAQAPAGPKLSVDGASAAAPAGPRAPQGGGLTALYKATLDAQGEPTDPYEADRNEIMKSRQAMAGEELTDAKARKEGLAALLGGRESRIKGREERAEKSENLNTKMAVINAGLAMMQSTGRGLAGIAEGATKGMGMYAEGLKLTAAERQKIEDAKDSFDELKFNSENLTQKEITAAKNKVSEVANMTREKHIQALMDDLKVKHEVAGKIFDKTVTMQEGAANRAAQITAAGMPSGQERLFKTLGDGDVKKGFQLFTDANQEGKGTQALLQAYVKEPMLLAELKTSNPQMYNRISSMIASQLTLPVVDVPKAALLARPSGG